MHSLIKKHIKILIYCCSIAILWNCKKKNIEEPVPTIITNPVVFYFNGTVAGSPLSIQAGVNEYYMYSSYEYDPGISTYWFIGELKQTNCSNCKNTLKIKISDDTTLTPTAPSHINQLSPGIYSYYSPNDSTVNFYTLNVYAVPVFSSSQTYQYFINNTNVANTANFSYTLSPLPATLSLNYSNYDTLNPCSTSLTNTLNLSANDDFYSYYKYNINSFSQVVTFSIYPNLPTTNSFTMDFGDSYQTITTSTLITHTYTNSAIYQAKLISKSNNGKIWTFQNNISTSFSNATCLGNYYYTINSNKTTHPFSKVIIEYTDESGIFYTSQMNGQPSSNNFQITKIEEYIKNNNNQPTKKISATFTVRVFASPTNFKDISGTIVFAVAYK